MSNNFFYNGFTEESINDFIEWSNAVNNGINKADTEEDKKTAEKDKKEFYREIESVKIKDIEDAIKSSEESGDNEKKALLERIKQEVQNARRVMYERKASDIIDTSIGLIDRRYSYNEYEYWSEAEVEDLIFSEQAIDEIKIDRNNFGNIAYRTSTDSIELAIKKAEEEGNIEKKERLTIIRNKIDRVRRSATIYAHRYQAGKESSVERKSDETVLSIIDRNFEELGQEAGAAFGGMNYIYVYLTNAKDKTDLLERLKVVDEKLDKYEEILKKEYGKETYKGAMQRAIDTAREDFESGDVLGIDKEVESR